MCERKTEAEWQRVTLYAAPQAIEARLKTARQARDAAQRTVDRWEALKALRAGQVEAGTWPEAARRAMDAEEAARQASWAAMTDGDGEQKTGDACTPACWTPAACPSCGNQLPPRGRSVPLAMGGLPACCDEARMNAVVNPRHLWNEEEASARP
jgi:hypothetical protein